jgi:hypothetical protein
MEVAAAKSSCVIFAFVSSLPLISEAEILAACEAAIRLAPVEFPPTLPPSEELLGAPGWYAFEHQAWPIGESVRQAFSKNPRLRRREVLLSKVAQVATCWNLRRGRQSFVMALGFVSARHYAELLAEFLDDPDVDGHVLRTLFKMRASGFAREANLLLLHSDTSWKRRWAQKYLDRFSSLDQFANRKLTR